MIDKAIIPAAGLGTRMLPITKSIPKEMLPLGRKPAIQCVVEEAVASGIKQIYIVIREAKRIIKDYFSTGYDLRRGGDAYGIEELEKLMAACELSFVEQREARGLGDAILQTRDFIGHSSFVMMIPDQILLAEVPATRQLVEGCGLESGICSSLVRLPKTELPFFTGARGFELEGDSYSAPLRLGRIQTEDETRAAYSSFDYEIRGFGRAIYPPEIFDYLGDEFTNPLSGEVDLLKTFEKCTECLEHRGLLLKGEACDFGTFEGYYRYLPRLMERMA